MAEKMLPMQEEHANELRPMRKQTHVTMHDVIRDKASTDAEHKEEKQRMQSHVAHLSVNAQEEKQIAIARINAKLRLRDNETSALQQIRNKYDKMMRENPVFQQSSEPVTSPVGRPVGFSLAGIQILVGIDRFKKPPNPFDLDPPASDSGPSEGRRRRGGPPGGPDPDPQDPPGRAPERNTDSKKSKASNITLPALPSPPGFHLWRSSVRDAVTASNTIQMPLILGVPQSKSQLPRLTDEHV